MNNINVKGQSTRAVETNTKFMKTITRKVAFVSDTA